MSLPVTTAKLNEQEIFWRDHQVWLEECGYLLRPRYMPDWQPSWEKNPKLFYLGCEDGHRPLLPHLILDATRISDGAQVVFKIVDTTKHPHEEELMAYFSSGPIASNAKNHCAPLYEVLKVPHVENRILLVMPLLRDSDDPPFAFIGEAVDFFGQIFEGLQFMHDNNIAHRDCTITNIMMNTAMFPDGFHPVNNDRAKDFSGDAKHYTRTQRRPKYYFIDFGMSRRYNDRSSLDDGIIGGDKTVPEFQNTTGLLNPFPTDIYCIGNIIRREFLQVKRGLEFMEPLVQDMVQDDPAKRPTIYEVVDRFSAIRIKLSNYKLRSRVASRKENTVSGLFRNIAHVSRRAQYTFQGLSADPGR